MLQSGHLGFLVNRSAVARTRRECAHLIPKTNQMRSIVYRYGERFIVRYGILKEFLHEIKLTNLELGVIF